jgi:hypothetical protein
MKPAAQWLRDHCIFPIPKCPRRLRCTNKRAGGFPSGSHHQAILTVTKCRAQRAEFYPDALM